MNCFKSALAFFFLFFLHGTSIGNGQQGISYNSHIHAMRNNAVFRWIGAINNRTPSAYRQISNGVLWQAK
jgi:hypothetical protein